MCIVWVKSVTDEMQHISKTVFSHRWHGGTWFWDTCKIALWDICCTLTTMWREHLKIQAMSMCIDCQREVARHADSSWRWMNNVLPVVASWTKSCIVGKKTAHLLPFSGLNKVLQWPDVHQFKVAENRFSTTVQGAGSHARACPPRVNKMMMFAKISYPE